MESRDDDNYPGKNVSRKNSGHGKSSIGTRVGSRKSLEKVSAEFKSSGDVEKAWADLNSLDLDGTALNEARREILRLIVEKKGTKYSLNFVCNNFGIGTIRDDLISTVFAYSKESKRDVLSLLNSLDDNRDRQSGKDGLLWEDLRPEDFAHLPHLTDECKDLLLIKMAHDAASISTANQNGFSKLIKVRISEISQMMDSGRLARSSLRDFLRYCGDNVPFQTWSLFSLGDLDPKEFPDDAISSITSSMITSDPAKAAIEFAANSLSDPSLVSKAFIAWRKLDATAVDEWFAANKNDLDSTTINSFQRAVALSSSGGENPDFSKAREAAAFITDSQTRMQAEGEIWSRERARVIEVSRKNPVGLINSILDGSSQHQTYWIETAMNEWVAKDRNAAWAWYEDNRESLTPEQNEAVALSYARQALQNGQADLAADWSRLVVTPKFQAKIRAEIEAVASSGR